MTYLWKPGQPIAVDVNRAGVPRSFRWRGHTHVVVLIANRWRVDEDWWQENASDSRTSTAGHVWREYFKVITQTGLLVILFHDLVTNTWWMQQTYD